MAGRKKGKEYPVRLVIMISEETFERLQPIRENMSLSKLGRQLLENFISTLEKMSKEEPKFGRQLLENFISTLEKMNKEEPK